jgi:hypothetical protein
LKQQLKSEDDASMSAPYDYFVTKAAPVAPKSEQFMDSFNVLSEQNPAIKNVDVSKMLDASYFQKTGG